jgi:predicted dehydrogenase
MIRIGVIGYGYWGPNIVRNFNGVNGAKVTAVCDLSEDMCQRVAKAYPGIEVGTDPNRILTSPDIDAVAVITPVFTHFDLAKKALENGKHVFVEKPFTSTVAQAEELNEIADKKKLTIMVDHTFIFTGAVRKIKAMVEEGQLGDLYYFDSTRVNLGLFQHDVNVVWDLAPHDFSIMDFILDQKPVALSATGQSHFNGLEDVAYVTCYFPGKLIAHFNVNWLSPVKVRTTLIGGTKKMLVWNDIDPDEKIKVYDKGVDVTTRESVYDLLVSYRSGDAWVPKVEATEALKLEAEYFVKCVTSGERPLNDGQSGLRVVQVLEAANKSISQRGALVEL